MALLGFKWSATTEATAETGEAALASDTLASSLVELQADNKATEKIEKSAMKRLDMVFLVCKN
jgi:hypothetical protein